MAFDTTTKSIIADEDILCNQKTVHIKMIKVMCSSGRFTITDNIFSHIVSGLQFVVKRLAW